MLTGLKPNPESCNVIAGSMLTVSIVYLVYVLGLRPYKSKLEQSLVTTNSLLQVTLSSLNLATLYEEQLFTTLGQVSMATFCFLYLQMGIVAIKELKEQYEKWRKSRPQALDSSIMDTMTEPLLLIPTSTNLSPSDRYISDGNSGDQPPLDDLSMILNTLLDTDVSSANSLPSEDVKPPMSPSQPSAHFSLSIFNSPGRLSPVEPEEDLLGDLLNRPARINVNPDEERANPLRSFRVREASMFASRTLPPQQKVSEIDDFYFKMET